MPIISDSHRFVFIHAHKTAGMSISSILSRYGDDRGLSRHQTARAVRDQIGRETFDHYFTFMFVRNPWDWLLSLYSYIREQPDHCDHKLVSGMSFRNFLIWRCRIVEKVRPPDKCEEFIENPETAAYIDFGRWCRDESGRIMVDFVGRFENLAMDWGVVCNMLGLPWEEIPRLNVGTPRKHYREFYSERMAEMVAEHFAEDIEWLGYEF